MGWNPANWAITDTLQGQGGGWTVDNSVLGRTAAAANSFQGSTPQGPIFSNPTGYVDTSGGGGGASTGGGGTTTPDPTQQQTQTQDPYAQWGGQGRYNSLVSGIDSSLNSIRQSGTDAFGSARSGLQSNAEGIFQNYRNAQEGINTSRQNNELNRLNAAQDLMGYIRSGMRQAGARLANNNATDSSAAGAFAQAYNKVGSDRMRGINNQAAIQGNQLDTQQNQLTRSRDEQLTSFGRIKDDAANQIGQDVRSKLMALDQQAAGLSLPDRIAVEQEKQNIVNAGMGQLQQVDQWLREQLGGVNQQSQEQIQQGALGLQKLGTASANPFQVNGFNQQLISSPNIDQLPLYSLRRKDQ